MSSYYYLFKFIVIGDSGVGKSCLVLQFTENYIRKNHDVTIGVEFGVKIVQIDGKNIKLQIWDTAGQENFRSLTRAYYRTAIGAIVVYDISRRDSFLHINDWIKEMKSNGNPNMVVLLIGNKKDKEAQRQVQTEEGQAVANENGFLFFETSARDSINVDEAFTKLAEQITKKVDSGEIPIGDNQTIKIGAEYSFYQSKSRDQTDQGGSHNLSQEKKIQNKSSCC
ncbi:hypothetical protein ABPG74_000242 [Tetrahymena malaccensis]